VIHGEQDKGTFTLAVSVYDIYADSH
jgi:hypothetical protein